MDYIYRLLRRTPFLTVFQRSSASERRTALPAVPLPVRDADNDDTRTLPVFLLVGLPLLTLAPRLTAATCRRTTVGLNGIAERRQGCS